MPPSFTWGENMARRARCSFFLFFAIPLCIAPLLAEDVKLREQAVHLMEVANAVSLTGGWATTSKPLRLPSMIHSLVPRRKGHSANFRQERMGAGTSHFRDYHAIRVISGDRLSDSRTGEEPPEVRELLRYIPIHLGRFDHEDVIRSIEDMNVLGRPAKCINFDTHFGSEMQANQICVDIERGALLRWHVGDELIENSQYFQIANLWEPGRIRRFVRGALQLEIDQRMTATQVPVDAKAFSPVSGHWQRMFGCKNKRRAVGISMPMPPAGTAGTGTVDVIVHGYIWDNGTVQPITIESSERPDLNAEALKLVATWKFLPLMCNDKPAATVADFVVHFQGR